MPSAPPLDPFDQLLTAAETAVAEQHGEEYLWVGEDVDDVWRWEPVDLDTFVRSREHLHLPPLFPLQRAAILALIGPDPKKVFEEPKTGDEKARQYQLAVLLWGKGSGKDYVCSIVVAYLVYILLCLRNPQAYFEFAPGEPIDVLNVAYNAEQAKKVFFEKFKQRLFRWQWLRENFDLFEGGRRKYADAAGRPRIDLNDGEVIFPRGIRCFSRHSENESYEGLNVIAWVMDEASAFLSKLKKENAGKIYQTLRTSAGSRFQRRWLGFIISYPRHADDFTMQKCAEARAHPEAGIFGDGPRATWEVNERLGRGDRVEVRPGHWVPIELANDYILDFEEALAKYECHPPLARDALIKDPQHVWAAVSKGRKPLIEWEPTVNRRQVVTGDGETVTREYAGIKLTKLRDLPKGARLFAHGDPARTSDGYALAFGHGVPATIELRVPASEVLSKRQLQRANAEEMIRAAAEKREPRLLTPDTLVPWERDVVRTVIDAVLTWRPDPSLNRHVDQLNVREVIQQIVGAYRIGAITFDQYDSAELVQWLETKKVAVENESWTNTAQHRMYRGARSAFYNDLITLPDTESITSEDPRKPGVIYELVRVEEIEGHKIDHPEGGSKDGADAVVRVIEHVTGQIKTSFSFGVVRADDSGDMGKVVLPGRAVDPTRTPSPSSAGLRAAEAMRAKQRPAGEIDAAAGVVTPKAAPRFSFGNASRGS